MCVALARMRLNCDLWDSRGLLSEFRILNGMGDGFSGLGLVCGWRLVVSGIWTEYFRLPDNRKALDCPYNCRMKILIPVMLTAVAVLACSGERGPQPTDLEQIAPGQVEPIVLAPRSEV